ncbi:hypothetical protein Ccrd_011249 [Cynara cardunculus var. scolymus]|uniref:Uncharacterized protein n=1 Tax=Cynara cardunculus var. scolymus TaxID=59895 RepID=A0A103YJQ5_CYNCS|nr:hypothetical protein Ccrd_011249 [Cynara cardunculus var. scolymus]
MIIVSSLCCDSLFHYSHYLCTSSNQQQMKTDTRVPMSLVANRLHVSWVPNPHLPAASHVVNRQLPVSCLVISFPVSHEELTSFYECLTKFGDCTSQPFSIKNGCFLDILQLTTQPGHHLKTKGAIIFICISLTRISSSFFFKKIIGFKAGGTLGLLGCFRSSNTFCPNDLQYYKMQKSQTALQFQGEKDPRYTALASTPPLQLVPSSAITSGDEVGVNNDSKELPSLSASQTSFVVTFRVAITLSQKNGFSLALLESSASGSPGPNAWRGVLRPPPGGRGGALPPLGGGGGRGPSFRGGGGGGAPPDGGGGGGGRLAEGARRGGGEGAAAGAGVGDGDGTAAGDRGGAEAVLADGGCTDRSVLPGGGFNVDSALPGGGFRGGILEALKLSGGSSDAKANDTLEFTEESVFCRSGND